MKYKIIVPILVENALGSIPIILRIPGRNFIMPFGLRAIFVSLILNGRDLVTYHGLN